MTESEWLASSDPAEMLRLAVGEVPCQRSNQGIAPHFYHKASDRKLRLFACAVWRTGLSRAGVAEEYPIYEARQQLMAGIRAAEDDPDHPNAALVHYTVHDLSAVKAARDTVFAPSMRSLVPGAEKAELLRDNIGNPFRPLAFDSAWRMPDVMALSRTAYEERQADGRLDPMTLLVLADALEEAGCNTADILWHLRGREWCPDCGGMAGEDRDTGGVTPWGDSISEWVPCERCRGTGQIALRSGHYRGCFALDAVLGRQ